MDQSGRIDALRAATLQFLTVIKATAKNPGDAKVGFVPFDGMVNTGYTYNTRPSWVRFDWWEDNYGSCEGVDRNNRADCVASYYCTKNSRYNTYTSKNSCQNANGTWKKAEWTPESKNNWKGCVYDRNKDYDVDDTAPTNNATYYPAAKCHSSTPVQAMTALTDSWSTLESRAKTLDPTGYTNITIGLAWGWHMLSNTGVFTEGAAYGTKDLTKYVILMTDGYNTKNIWMGDDACPTNGPECPDMDPRTTLACDKIKAAKIQIYTVRLINGNETLLKNCATSHSMYYDVKSTSELAGAFKNIASQIASLHLSK
jgi:hypothetical protein